MMKRMMIRNRLRRMTALTLAMLLLTGVMPGLAEESEGVDYAVPEYVPVTLEAESVDPIPLTEDTPYAPHEDAYLEDDSGYLDPSLSVRIETMRAYETEIMLVWVQIADASQLRTATYRKYPAKSTARADVIAKREKAVLAINGDFFLNRSVGYIVRNGELLRDKVNKDYDLLIIDDEGDMHIIPTPTKEKLAAYTGTVAQTFSFGPGLIIDGEKCSEWGDAICAPNKRTQRIALCQMDHLSYLIVATEGPENRGSQGLKLTEFIDLLYALGVQQAYNMDGGSSTWVVLGGEKINANSGIRYIGDILYFVTAVPEE